MDDKKERLIALDFHRRKLVTLVGELLKKADEIDRATRENKQSTSEEWNQTMASTCRELAALNETVKDIEALIKNSNVRGSEEALMRCTDIANHLSGRLNELKRQVIET